MASYEQKRAKRSPVDLYTNLSHEMKRETSVLINDKEGPNRSAYDDERYSDVKQLSRVNTTYTSSKKREYPERINGVINLCETDKHEGASEYRQMMSAEKEILDLLKQTGPDRQIRRPREYRNENSENEIVNIRHQSYVGQSPSQKKLNESKYGLRGQNPDRRNDKSNERKYQRNNEKNYDRNNERNNQRVQDMIGEDFSIEDLDFLRGLSKDELIKRLIKALRLYRSEKKKRMWIQNQLRRILGVQAHKQSYQGHFGGNQELYSPIRKEGGRVKSKEPHDNDVSIYGGMSECNSPRKVQMNNRSLNEISPVTLNSEKKDYVRQKQFNPLRSATRNQSQEESPAFRQNYKSDKKNVEQYPQNDAARISFNPEHERYYEKKNSYNNLNESPEKASNRDYSYVSERRIADVLQNSGSKVGSGRKIKRLHTIGGDHPGMLDLWEQGEAIRKETVTLVSMKKEASGNSKYESKSRKQYQRPVYNEVIEESNMKESYDDLEGLPVEQKKRRIQAITRATYN